MRSENQVVDQDPVGSETSALAEPKPDPECIPDPVCFISRDMAPYRITGVTCLVGDEERGFIVESGDNREDGVQAGEGASHHHHLDRLTSVFIQIMQMNPQETDYF
jgi:hypothetical protein